jgi:hypothetical protein
VVKLSDLVYHTNGTHPERPLSQNYELMGVVVQAHAGGAVTVNELRLVETKKIDLVEIFNIFELPTEIALHGQDGYNETVPAGKWITVAGGNGTVSSITNTGT